MKSNRFWLTLLSGIFVVSSAAAVWIWLNPSDTGAACVYQDGKLIRQIALDSDTEPYSFTVEHDGCINVISVEDGRIWMSGSNCPDGACIRQGELRSVPIICLPHKLVIEPEGRKQADLDAVAR